MNEAFEAHVHLLEGELEDGVRVHAQALRASLADYNQLRERPALP